MENGRKVSPFFEKMESPVEFLGRVGLDCGTEGLPDSRGEPKRFLFQWHLTERCNCRCSHCYQEGYESNGENGLPANLEILGKIGEFIREREARCHFNFTGGEPLFSDSLFPLLETLRSAYRERMSFALLSNGTLLGRAQVKMLKKLGCRFIQVSIEGTEPTHDSIRGKGNFRQVAEALDRIRFAGIPSMVSFTASTRNYLEFPEVADFCSRHGVRILWSDRLIPSLRSRDAGLHPLETAQVREFFAKMRESLGRLDRQWFNRTRVRMHRALQFLENREGREVTKPYRCSAGRTLLTILPDGTVMPCRRLPLAAGKLPRDDLGEMYRNSPLLRLLRNPPGPPEGCGSCEYLEACAGGLRCLTHALSGTPFGRDPNCYHLAVNQKGG